ncbi:hypothetical protein MCEMIH16_00724 [Caulobacteraceae bacterium]
MIGLAVTLMAAFLSWPDLPTTGFVSGRVATDVDIIAGNAVFSQGSAPGVSSPLPLVIPQYACWTGENAGRQPVILIQAETGLIGDLVGLRTPRGEEIAATLSEVALLGVQRPADKDCQ